MSQHVISIREIIAIALTMAKRTDLVVLLAMVCAIAMISRMLINVGNRIIISQGNFRCQKDMVFLIQSIKYTWVANLEINIIDVALKCTTTLKVQFRLAKKGQFCQWSGAHLQSNTKCITCTCTALIGVVIINLITQQLKVVTLTQNVRKMTSNLHSMQPLKTATLRLYIYFSRWVFV